MYASWNGVTGVSKWRVLAGKSTKHLSAVATKGKTGFETVIDLSKKYKSYEVVALDSKGRCWPPRRCSRTTPTSAGTRQPHPRAQRTLRSGLVVEPDGQASRAISPGTRRRGPLTSS